MAKYQAIFPASDPDDIASCPDDRVTVTVLPYGRVRLVGDYDDLIRVLVNFVGLPPAEADVCIEEVV